MAGWFGPVGNCGCCECISAECECDSLSATPPEGSEITYRLTFYMPSTVFIKGDCECPDYLAQFDFGVDPLVFDFTWRRKCIDGVLTFENLGLGFENQTYLVSIPGRAFPDCEQPGFSSPANLTVNGTLFDYGSGLRPRVTFYCQNQFDVNNALFFDIEICDTSCGVWYPFEFVLPGNPSYGYFSEDCESELDYLGIARGIWNPA